MQLTAHNSLHNTKLHLLVKMQRDMTKVVLERDHLRSLVATKIIFLWFKHGHSHTDARQVWDSPDRELCHTVKSPQNRVGADGSGGGGDGGGGAKGGKRHRQKKVEQWSRK